MRQLRRAVEAAEVRGLFDLTAMHRFMTRSQGRPGMRALREALEIYRQPVFTRSELERRFLDLCDSEALPRPAVNFFVEGKEADMVWLDERLVVELDGRETHRTHAAFEDDRVRDATLQLAGYRVLRVTDRRLRRAPAEVAQTVRFLLDRGSS